MFVVDVLGGDDDLLISGTGFLSEGVPLVIHKRHGRLEVFKAAFIGRIGHGIVDIRVRRDGGTRGLGQAGQFVELDRFLLGLIFLLS